jgi:hypothetical protein
MSGDQPKPTVASFGPFQADLQTQEIRKHTNFDQINTGFSFDPIHFGQVMNARDPRIIQLGLKVLF